jgi:UPF0716 family protein affecting phage T7 exclusion
MLTDAVQAQLGLVDQGDHGIEVLRVDVVEIVGGGELVLGGGEQHGGVGELGDDLGAGGIDVPLHRLEVGLELGEPLACAHQRALWRLADQRLERRVALGGRIESALPEHALTPGVPGHLHLPLDDLVVGDGDGDAACERGGGGEREGDPSGEGHAQYPTARAGPLPGPGVAASTCARPEQPWHTRAPALDRPRPCTTLMVRMPRIRTLLFVVAIVEIVLLVALGRVLGGTTVLLGATLSAVLGMVIARREGARALRGWQAATARGELPTGELAESAMVVIAGALLMIPGPLTDVAALTLLIPPVRRRAAGRLRAALQHNVAVRSQISQAVTRAGARVIDLDADDVREHRG